MVSVHIPICHWKQKSEAMKELQERQLVGATGGSKAAFRYQLATDLKYLFFGSERTLLGIYFSA